MNKPDRIHINLNAADGFERFEECGMRITESEDLNRDKIMTMLAAQKGRLFRLLGWADGSDELILRIHDTGDEVIQIRSDEPPFCGEYAIVATPPPQVGLHGGLHL